MTPCLKICPSLLYTISNFVLRRSAAQMSSAAHTPQSLWISLCRTHHKSQDYAAMLNIIATVVASLSIRACALYEYHVSVLVFHQSNRVSVFLVTAIYVCCVARWSWNVIFIKYAFYKYYAMFVTGILLSSVDKAKLSHPMQIDSIIDFSLPLVVRIPGNFCQSTLFLIARLNVSLDDASSDGEQRAFPLQVCC